jgi:ABC-type Fe3+/spermidine/putrescine transport system ATPase subunit
MSDKIAVMDAGRIVQIGSKKTVLENPRSQFVAKFLGFNVIEGHVASLKDEYNEVIVDVNGVNIRTKAEKIAIGKKVDVILKPQDVMLSTDAEISKPKWKNCRCNTLSGKIIEVSNLGSMASIIVDVGFQVKSDIGVDYLEELDIIEGCEIFVQFRPQKTKLIPKLNKLLVVN